MSSVARGTGVARQQLRCTRCSAVPATRRTGMNASKEGTLRGGSRSASRLWLEDTRVGVSTLDAPTESSIVEHVMWFDKYPEHWTQAHSEEELLAILLNETEKMIFIDFYAGFCGACKAAFPSLSRVAGNPDFKKDFLFVKCCVTDEGIRDYVRKNGITGIPTAMVCAPGGEKLVSFGASFRRINAVKANLVVMAANRGAQFTIDPNGYVMPLMEHV